MPLSVREKKNKNGRKSWVMEVEFQRPRFGNASLRRSKGREGKGTENQEQNTKCKCPEAETYLVPELQYGGETVKR